MGDNVEESAPTMVFYVDISNASKFVPILVSCVGLLNTQHLYIFYMLHILNHPPHFHRYFGSLYQIETTLSITPSYKHNTLATNLKFIQARTVVSHS